jgi:ArsR family transcriptional regulator
VAAAWKFTFICYFDNTSNIVDEIILTSYITPMKLETAALILSKIGNPTRLKIVRLLVRAGNQGMPVGAIQKKLKIPGSTLTHHITHLKNAGLIHQERHQATLFCKIQYERLNQLVDYLTDECCIDDATATGDKVA